MKNYVAGLNGRKIELQAASLYEAKTKALALLKPSKKDLGLVWVAPVEQRVESAGCVALVIDPGLMN